MRTNRIKIVIAASCLALLGLIAIQVRWMNYSRVLLDEQFEHRVDMALCNAVQTTAEEPTKKMRKSPARPAAKSEAEAKPAAKPRAPRKPAAKPAEAKPDVAPAGDTATPAKAPAKRVRKPAAPKASESKE